LYLLLFFRFIVAAHKATTLFGKLLIVGLGFPMIFQAMVNMAVAVELLPVTGQTLPLISSGGSSIWMTCIALGIIINVTKKEEEIAEEIKDKARRESALQKLIDKQLEEEDSPPNPPEGRVFQEEIEENNKNYSIEEKANNPMTAIERVKFSNEKK
jgi:cell division protein FtsW